MANRCGQTPSLIVSVNFQWIVIDRSLALDNPHVDAMPVKWSAMGLAIAKAAQHKLAAVLHHHLQPRGILVGEVVVNALVKGTAFDAGAHRGRGRVLGPVPRAHHRDANDPVNAGRRYGSTLPWHLIGDDAARDPAAAWPRAAVRRRARRICRCAMRRGGFQPPV